ncbi:MAG: radical SAM protein [Bacillaceae bacterium]|nr:radical SAM protein [Bacillaceae bacterium]
MNMSKKQAKSILTPASGYLRGYTFSLNPYTGCSFGCSYCYVRKMPVNLFRKEEWGTWVDVKENAGELYLKELARARKKYEHITIFMSSSTDPYQPVEIKEEITRSILAAMVEMPPDFLLLQTRSPLVTRDMDLLKRLKDHLLVSITVETDREDIRKIFTPVAPPVAGRLRALAELKREGIPAQAAVSPILPCSEEFGRKLSAVVDRVTIDDYFMGDGSGGKRTKSLRIRDRYVENGLEDWFHPDAYKKVMAQFKKSFLENQIFVSQEGFLPPVIYKKESKS